MSKIVGFAKNVVYNLALSSRAQPELGTKHIYRI